MRAVVNFVPVLLEQLEDYAAQFASGALRDPLLAAARQARRRSRSRPRNAQLVLGQCFRANHEQLIAALPRVPAPARAPLAAGDDGARPGRLPVRPLSRRPRHLVPPGVDRRDRAPRASAAARLMTEGAGFSDARARGAARHDRRGDRCRSCRAIARLAEAGVIELSTTPAHAPARPAAARLRLRARSLPDAAAAGGSALSRRARARCDRQIDEALDRHARASARAATACGRRRARCQRRVRACARRALGALDRQRRSRCSATACAARAGSSRRPRRPAPTGLPALAPDVMCLFRDDRLSDLIGFEYSKWHGGDAARALRRRAGVASPRAAPAGEPPLVAVILDGENAWEYYPYNGYYFLEDLYELLAAHRVDPTVHDARVDRWREASLPPASRSVRRAAALVAGSWVYRQSHDLDRRRTRTAPGICCARPRPRFDAATRRRRSRRRAQVAAASASSRSAESSDWFWWFGDYNPARVGGALRSPVPREPRAPVPAARAQRPRRARHAGQPRQRPPRRPAAPCAARRDPPHCKRTLDGFAHDFDPVTLLFGVHAHQPAATSPR